MRIIYFIGLLSIIGCNNDSGTINRAKNFDLPQFTQELVATMTAKRPEVHKRFVLNGNSESKDISTTDSTFWANELSVLLNTDPNSPKYLGELDQSARIQDSNSNLFIDRFIASSQDVDLQMLEIYYLEDTSQIRKINLELKTTNFISESYLIMTAWINQYGSELLIDSVVTSGTDKVVFQDERMYESHLMRIRK